MNTRTKEQEAAKSVLGSWLPVWCSPQTDLAKIVRFSTYTRTNTALREQNDLQHCYSVCLVASFAATILKKRNPNFDIGLLLYAFIVHEYAEGELQRDVIYRLKSEFKDLEEYEAFERKFRPLGDLCWSDAKKAFLLQFAEKNPGCFPDDARQIIAQLRKEKPQEILAFPAIEAFDYLFYVFEGFITTGDEIMITQVLRNQLPRLDNYARIVLGFDIVWTEEKSAWCHDFLTRHEHITDVLPGAIQ